MAALTAVATNQSRGDVGPTIPYTQPASTTNFGGGLVMINSAGEAVPAAATAGNNGCKGVVTKTHITAAGETDEIAVERGQWRLPQVGLAATDVGDEIFCIDDSSVGPTAANRPAVGELLALDGAFAWVLI